MNVWRWILAAGLWMSPLAGASPEPQDAAPHGHAEGGEGASPAPTGAPGPAPAPPVRERRSHWLDGRPISGVPPFVGGHALSQTGHGAGLFSRPGSGFWTPGSPGPGRVRHDRPYRPGVEALWTPAAKRAAANRRLPGAGGRPVVPGGIRSLTLRGPGGLPNLRPGPLVAAGGRLLAFRPLLSRATINGSDVRTRPPVIDGSAIRSKHLQVGTTVLSGTSIKSRH